MPDLTDWRLSKHSLHRNSSLILRSERPFAPCILCLPEQCCDVFIWLYSQLWCTIQILSVLHRKALERSQLCRLKWKSGLLKMHSRCGDGHRSVQLIWWRNSEYILGMSGLHVWRGGQKQECWPLLSLQSFWPQIFAASHFGIHIECVCCAIQMKSFDTSTN